MSKIKKKIIDCAIKPFRVNEKKTSIIIQDMPDDGLLMNLSELFKIFGDSTRIKILYVLSKSEICVCDISRLTDISQSAISQHLRILKQANLVKYRREGKNLYYSIADSHVHTIINMGIEHINEL